MVDDNAVKIRGCHVHADGSRDIGFIVGRPNETWTDGNCQILG